MGQFKCIDKERNIILERTDEFVKSCVKMESKVLGSAATVATANVKEILERELNMVMIPGKHIVDIEVVEQVAEVEEVDRQREQNETFSDK